VLGTGKNYKFLEKLNKQEKFTEQLIPLEHPRFVMQYRAKRKQEFIEKYLRLLGR
jgi:hexokinase